MKINANHVLTDLLLRNLKPDSAQRSQVTDGAGLLNALSLAKSVDEKERIIAELKRLVTDARQHVPVELSESDKSAGPVNFWPVSVQSIESMNGLQTDSLARQWETETVVRAIMGQLLEADPQHQLNGVAIPFTPTALDMERAVASLTTPKIRQVFEWQNADVESRPESSRALRAEIIRICLLGLCVASVVFAISML